MTGSEQERTPLDLPRLEAHIQAALSAGLPTPDLSSGLQASDDAPVFRALIEALRSEPLLEPLDGKIMHCGGGGGGQFSLRLLAYWLVSRSATHGVQDPLALLSTWAAQDYNEGFDIVLLSGVEVKEPLSLDGDISLTPIEAVPHPLLVGEFSALQNARSKLNELASFNTPSTNIIHCLLPSAALIRSMKFRPRAWAPDKALKIKAESPPPEDLCWCFAALGSCWPQPHACYSVLADSVPAADLLGSSHSQPQSHYSLGYGPTPLEQEDRARAQHIFRRFKNLKPKRRQRFLPALEWLSMAKRRARMEQRCVDLGIVVESLFTQGERADQIALTVRTRGAWLLGRNYEGRREVYRQIRNLYAARSFIVHGRKAREGRSRSAPTSGYTSVTYYRTRLDCVKGQSIR